MRTTFQYLWLISIGLFLSGCGQMAIHPPFEPVDLAQKYNGNYKAKVDTFHVIVDASSSMHWNYNKEMKFAQATRVLQNMNETIPTLDVVGGIRAFGPAPYNTISGDPLLYGMAQYVQKDFGAALKTISRPAGTTPLAKAISMAANDLGAKAGPSALIIVSDWENVGSSTVAAAQEIKNRYGEQLCIYPILIGDAPGARKLTENVATAGGCGFATDYATLNSSEGMANFVDKVFLETIVNRDSDHDGVLDAADSCPTTPQGSRVDRYGCALVEKVRTDSDRDGVYDDEDRCPGTPYGLKVDAVGCPLPITKKTSIKLRVEFDVDKYFIRPEYRQTLREFADFMKEYPNLTATIEGHTDNSGSDAYNQQLSEQRAASVAQYLTTYFNVPAKRLKSIGYGESKPETTNATEAGKQKNRRVMAVLKAR